MRQTDNIAIDEAGAVVTNEALNIVLERYENGREHDDLQNWYENLAFFAGNQYVRWDKSTNKLVTPEKPSWRVRLTFNHIMPRVRTEHAKLTINRHVWEVLPATAEEEDTNVAKVSTKFLDAKWRELEMDDTKEEAILWALTTGTGFVKTWWDEGKYRDDNLVPLTNDEGIPIDESGNPLPEDAEPLMIPRQEQDGRFAPIGDIDCAAISPFEIIPDPSASKMDDCQWIIHAKRWPKQIAEERWGIQLETDGEAGNWFDKLKGMVASTFGRASNDSEDEDMVLVLELWERPSQKYPDGRLVVVAGNQLVHDGVNPMPQGELPFVMFRHIVVPGKFWGESIIKQLISPQKEYNRTISQITEIKNRTSNPQKLLPVSSGIDPDKWTGEPGLVIPYNPVAGQAPGYITPPPVQPYMFKLLEHNLSDLDQISGQHEVSHGQTPPGVKSGVAIRFLQEQDDTKLGPTARSIERGWRKLAVMWLKMAKAMYKPEENRMVKYVGKNRQIECFDFDSQKIPMEPDVIIISGSALPESKSARQDFLKELYQLGVFVDPKTGRPDNAKFMKMLEIGGVDEAFDDISTDMNAAEIENKLMERGQEQWPHEWDNHELHIYQHNKYRKSTDFMALPEEIRALYGRHIKIHETALTGMIPWTHAGDVDVQMLMMQHQMGQQQMAMGAPQGPGMAGMPGMAPSPNPTGGQPTMAPGGPTGQMPTGM
jgi:hypothetical protein